METNTGWQITGNAAQLYEKRNVPTIFTAWANHLLERAQLEEGDHVLDVACGTGIVSRFAKEAVGERGRVVGVDLNPGMLEVAASTASSKNLNIAWVQSDAAAIPLSEPEFDVAFCQQGLQFFPDKLGALKEVRRLLKPDGRCIICVAREKELCTNVKAQYDAVAKHVGPDAAAAFAAVSGLSSRDQLQQLFDDAGFTNVHIESVKLMVENEDGVEFVRGTILASPIGSIIVEWDEAAREELVADILKGYGECFDGQRLRFPHVSHVVVASNA
jgi:ubiquinone/menaquinone biosynthesis C-methylase UbiE